MFSLYITLAYGDLIPPPQPRTPNSVVQQTINDIHIQNPYINENENFNCTPDSFPKEYEYGDPIHPS